MSDKQNIPESLKEALLKNKVIPFIGAGLSRSVEKKEKDSDKSFNPLFPNWEEYIKILADVLIAEKDSDNAEYVLGCLKPNPKKYLEAMQHAFESLGESLWYQTLRKYIPIDESLADENSLEASRIAWKLGSNLLITTNIDLVLRWTSPKPKEHKELINQTIEFAELQQRLEQNRPTVFHLHGHIDAKDSIIFTKQSYEDFYDKESNKAKLETLKALLTQYTFLFIGFSLDDVYFLKQIEYLHNIYKGASDSFYVLLPEKEKDNPNIPKYVKKVLFSNFGQPFLDKLQELANIANQSKPIKIQSTPEIPQSTEKKESFYVPFASKGDEFFGREDKLIEIHESLKLGKRTNIGQAHNIQGLGGLGKTQLAVEYAYRFRNDYKRGVFWLTADGDMQNDLITIAEAEKWIVRDDKSINQFDVSKEKFLQLKDCLIIIDNVEKVEEIKSYLPKHNKSIHILITSRTEQEGFSPIDLETLDKDESEKLLRSTSKKTIEDDNERESFGELIKELDGLPLALELVGGYLSKRKNISFQKYLEFFNNEPLENLEKLFPNENFTNHDKSIIRTLKVSQEILENTPYLEEILDVLAWSGSSPMEVSLLSAMIQPKNEFEFENALGVALELKLLKHNANSKRFEIHRLLGRVIRLEDKLNKDKDWHQKVLNGLINWFEEREDQFNERNNFEDMLDHLEKWEKNSFEIFKLETIKLSHFKAYPFYNRGNYKKAKEILEDLLNLYQKENLNEQELLANLKNRLGNIYGDLGNYQEALVYGKEALEIRQNLFHGNHKDIAQSLNNVGGTYGDLGNHPKALEYLEKALVIYQELFGEKHPHVATSLNNVGGTYGDLGNHPKALEYLEKALVIRQELFGNSHPYTILVCFNVIISLQNLKLFSRAGILAAEFFPFVPQNNEFWGYFEEVSRPYRKKKNRHKKR